MHILMNIWTVSKNLKKKNCLLKNISLLQKKKKGKIGDDGKISVGHISLKDYLTYEKFWDKFEIEKMGDYHNHYLKKDVLFIADVFEKFADTCLKFLWTWTLF